MANENEEEFDADEISNAKNPVKVLTIGIGQGGAKLAADIATNFDQKKNVVYINTSKRDIEGLEIQGDFSRFISVGEGAIDGAGKDRSVAFNYFKKNLGNNIEEAKKYAKEDNYDFIFICFSTAGGTGSGIGPKLTGALTSNAVLDEIESATGKCPIVFGIAELPEISTNEGNLSFENTLEALDEINKIVNPRDKETDEPLPNGFGRFILVNNGFGKNGYATHEAQLSALNTKVSQYLKRYLTFFGTSRVGTLDRSDRLSVLKTMGIHSFISYNRVNGNTIESPFIVPNGERVKRCTYEVYEKEEEKVTSVIQRTGCIIDDIIHGYHSNTNSEDFMPIISFNGFKNVSKIAEQYSNRLKLNRENQTRIENDNLTSSTGFKDLAKEVENRKAEYSASGASDANSVFDL